MIYFHRREQLKELKDAIFGKGLYLCKPNAILKYKLYIWVGILFSQLVMDCTSYQILFLEIWLIMSYIVLNATQAYALSWKNQVPDYHFRGKSLTVLIELKSRELKKIEQDKPTFMKLFMVAGSTSIRIYSDCTIMRFCIVLQNSSREIPFERGDYRSCKLYIYTLTHHNTKNPHYITDWLID